MPVLGGYKLVSEVGLGDFLLKLGVHKFEELKFEKLVIGVDEVEVETSGEEIVVTKYEFSIEAEGTGRDGSYSFCGAFKLDEGKKDNQTLIVTDSTLSFIAEPTDKNEQKLAFDAIFEDEKASLTFAATVSGVGDITAMAEFERID